MRRILDVFSILILTTMFSATGWAEPTEIVNVNADRSAVTNDADLAAVFKANELRALDPAAHATVPGFTDKLTALVKSMVGPEDKSKKVYVVLVDDMRPNAAYGKVGADRAVVVINLGLVRRLPDIDEIGASLGHELGHGPNETQDFAEALKGKSKGLAALVKRASENEADIRSALVRMERAGLNPHAMTTLLHRLRGMYGDFGGRSHSSFSSRTDSVGTALAARVRLGLAPSSKYRLDDKTRDRSWLAPIQEQWIETDAFRARQDRELRELHARPKPLIEERLEQLVSPEPLPKELAAHANVPDDRFFETVIQGELERLEQILGDEGSERVYEAKLELFRRVDRAMLEARARIPRTWKPQDPARLNLLYGFVARRTSGALGLANGEYMALPRTPFRLRAKMQDLQREIDRRDIEMAMGEEGTDTEDLRLKNELAKKELSRVTKDYEGSRRIYIERPDRRAEADFDRRVDEALQYVDGHANKLPEVPAWAQIDPVRWGFRPRVIDDIAHAGTVNEGALDREFREHVVEATDRIGSIFAPLYQEKFPPLFPGAAGAKAFLEAFLRRVEKAVTSEDEYWRGHDYNDLAENRRRKEGWGWMNFVDQAAGAPGFDPEAWLEKFLKTLETHARTIEDLTAVTKLVDEWLKDEKGQYYNKKPKRIAMLEEARDRIAKRDRLPIVQASLAKAKRPNELIEQLHGMNAAFRVENHGQRTTKPAKPQSDWTWDDLVDNLTSKPAPKVLPSEEHARRVDAFVSASARRLLTLSRNETPALTQAEAEALVWLSIPAALERHPRAAEIRAKTVEGHKSFSVKFQSRREGQDLHPYDLVQPFSFNEVVEFFTGDPLGTPTKEVVEFIERTPSLVSSEYKYRENIDYRDAARINAARLEWVEKHAPNSFHAASRAAHSAGHMESALVPRLDAVMRRWVEGRIDPENLAGSVRNLLIESDRSFTKEGKYNAVEETIAKVVEGKVLGPVASDAARHRRLLSEYIDGVLRAQDVITPRRSRHEPKENDGFSMLLGDRRPQTFTRLVPQELLDKAVPEGLVVTNDTELRELVQLVAKALKHSESSPELDLVFDRVWRLTEGKNAIRAAFLDEALVQQFFFAENRLKLARWQLETQFRVQDLAAKLEAGQMPLPRMGTRRQVIVDLGRKIERQFPEKSSLRNVLIHELQDLLLTNDVETDHFRALGVDYENWKPTTELAFVDLPQQLAHGAETPGERMKLVEYFLGLTSTPPSLRLDRMPPSLKDRLQPGDVPRVIRAARQAFIDGSRPVRSYVIQALLGDGDEGVLENSRTHEAVIRLVLGSNADYEVPRKFLEAYLAVVPKSEKKFILSYILSSFVESQTKSASLKTILEALGPMGVYAGQFLRTSSALPAHVRVELDGFLNRALAPQREEILRLLRESFGPNFVEIVELGPLRGSGKINATVRVRLRDPQTGATRVVTVRLLKDHVAEQSDAEFQVIDAALTRLEADSNPEVRRMARVGRDAATHAHSAIGPGGEELDHGREQDLLKEGGPVRRAYERRADRDGVRVDVVRVDSELQKLVVPGRRNRVTVFEDVEHTPLWEIADPAERALWAQKIVEAERSALLTLGLFDPDGHPGNWLIDRKNKRLVRIDIGQFQMLKKSELDAVQKVFEFLATEKPTARSIEGVVAQFKTLFHVTTEPAKWEEAVRWLLNHPDLPPHTSPEDRLYFFQEQLEKHFAAKDANFHVSLSKLARHAMSSLMRMKMYAEHAGDVWVARAVVGGLPWTARARVAAGGNRWVERGTAIVECMARLAGLW